MFRWLISEYNYYFDLVNWHKKNYRKKCTFVLLLVGLKLAKKKKKAPKPQTLITCFNDYYDYLCIRYTIFPDFSAKKLDVYIIHGN